MLAFSVGLVDLKSNAIIDVCWRDVAKLII